MNDFLGYAKPQIGRRSFLRSSGTVAAGVTAFLGPPEVSAAHFGRSRKAPLPAPKPILGGFNAPPLIHEFIPGPDTITLPFTGITLQGVNVEPSTITDFRGVTALAYHVGTVTGSDGVTYNLETDIRGFEGEYVAEDGSRREGTFAEM